jgi:hypothetical protein
MLAPVSQAVSRYALKCRIFVLKWAKRIDQQRSKHRKVWEVEKVPVQVVVGANLRKLPCPAETFPAFEPALDVDP